MSLYRPAASHPPERGWGAALSLPGGDRERRAQAVLTNPALRSIVLKKTFPMTPYPHKKRIRSVQYDRPAKPEKKEKTT